MDAVIPFLCRKEYYTHSYNHKELETKDYGKGMM